MKKRVFLFLQGVCSPFFGHLADQLKLNGHHILRVNFNVGDFTNWWPRDSFQFRGKLPDLQDYLNSLYRTEGVSDQILFGDRRPVHRPAIEGAKNLGIRTHVFEEGYFRPHWITLEREGVNSHSLLPRDPKWYLEVGPGLPDYGNGQYFNSKFWNRAVHDIAYHLPGSLNRFFFPHYKTHALVNAATEYGGYALRFSRLRIIENKRSKNVLNQIISSGSPFFLLPLQLNSDAQIRDHSQFRGMCDLIDFVFKSFSNNSPKKFRLVVKNHPLDNGLFDYRSFIRIRSREFGIADRVDYLDGGDLEIMLKNAAGVVTVNSTVGALSLQLKCPTIALSDPVYNLPGLTFQGALDDFWRNNFAPNAEFFRFFRNTVIHATQVNGGFYSKAGIRLGVENSYRILESDCSPLEKLLQ